MALWWAGLSVPLADGVLAAVPFANVGFLSVFSEFAHFFLFDVGYLWPLPV